MYSPQSSAWPLRVAVFSHFIPLHRDTTPGVGELGGAGAVPPLGGPSLGTGVCVRPHLPQQRSVLSGPLCSVGPPALQPALDFEPGLLQPDSLPVLGEHPRPCMPVSSGSCVFFPTPFLRTAPTVAIPARPGHPACLWPGDSCHSPVEVAQNSSSAWGHRGRRRVRKNLCSLFQK